MGLNLCEYRCKECNKLLCKGLLTDNNSILEVKCRGCGLISTFTGRDAQVIQRRSVLIKQGLIPDTDITS